MTFNNSVLLIIKQNSGIDYKDLLAKITQRYKSPASAKSALARSLKDMAAFGFIKREASKLFITDKGLSSMSIEMKDKLVLRLNEEIKRPMHSLDEIAKLLIILYQRGSQDKDLLNNAKENASFTISDIEELRRKIRAQRSHLKKISLLLQQQVEKLCELDFNDSFQLAFDEHAATRLALFCRGQKIVVETKDKDVLAKIPEHWKKQGIISVEGENISLLTQLFSSMPSAKAMLYLSNAKISLMAGKATFFGPYKTVKSFSEMKIADEVKQQIANEPKKEVPADAKK